MKFIPKRQSIPWRMLPTQMSKVYTTRWPRVTMTLHLLDTLVLTPSIPLSHSSPRDSIFSFNLRARSKLRGPGVKHQQGTVVEN